MRLVNGRYSADYEKAVTIAQETLEDYGIVRMPLQLDLILDALSNEVRLMSYSDMMARYHLERDDVKEMLQSDLGACAYDAKSTRYVIYYNDDYSDATCRFTIGHELGHILLEHHIQAGTEFLGRSFIPMEQYREYEHEADAFSRNLLSPAPLAQKLMQGGRAQAERDLQYAFFITGKAARVRLDLLSADLAFCTRQMTDSLLQLRIIHYYASCRDCGYALPDVVEFCPACGSTKRKRQLFFRHLPEPIRTDPVRSLLMCPHCGNTDLSLGAKFCKICGRPAINVCVGHQRGRFAGVRHYNPHYARFCLVCGAKTVFNTYNVLREDIEYMHPAIDYNDGVPYDEETMRIEQCPRCHNRQFSQHAQYCRICGMDLYNRCDGMEQDGYGNWYPNPQAMHYNPSNARFCETCGRPTFFFTEKILCGYKDFKPEDTEVDDDSWLQNNDLYAEIAAAPESEGYIPEIGDLQVNPQTVSSDDEDLPF